MTDHPADDAPALADFPARSHDKLRYGDTDRQGHVNHAVSSSLLETGRVDTGTRVLRVGRSSVTLGQALFQDGRAVARAVTVSVQVDDASHGPRPLSETAAARFGELAVSPD